MADRVQEALEKLKGTKKDVSIRVRQAVHSRFQPTPDDLAFAFECANVLFETIGVVEAARALRDDPTNEQHRGWLDATLAIWADAFLGPSQIESPVLSPEA